VVLAGAYGLHVSGMLKLASGAEERTANLLEAAEGRISDLEKQIADLGNRQDSGELRTLVSGFGGRLKTLETSVKEAASASVPDMTPQVDALKSDLADLRSEISKLPAPGATGGADTAALKAVDERVAALESAAGKAEAFEANATALESKASDLETKASDLEATASALKTSIADLQTRMQNTETTAKAAQSAVATSDVSVKTLADSQARASETLATLSADIQTVAKTGSAGLAEIRSELDVLSKRVASIESTMGDATAREVAARALSVSALKSAVDSGRPFETELAAVRAGLPKDTDLSALEAYAKTGVTQTSVLIAEFPAVARSMFAAITAPDQEGDILDSFLAGAKSIIAVRGPGDADGTGPQAELRRMENAVSGGDLAGALKAYGALPDAAKQAGTDWAKRAEARVSIDKMTEAASNEVLSRLAGKDS
jgi:hypothetical protein